jgi:hypothetical protein
MVLQQYKGKDKRVENAVNISIFTTCELRVLKISASGPVSGKGQDSQKASPISPLPSLFGFGFFFGGRHGTE